jgi:hypothetical protein
MAETKPNIVAILRGIIEKEKMPSNANLNNLVMVTFGYP